MFPNAVKEGLEGAWTSVALGQAAEGEAKAKHGEKALKRFERILAADPNRRDALLGRAAAALLVGKDGSVKRTAHEPLDADDLFAQIDQMPMRRREIRERGR